jgi:hypothetical protein
MATPKTNKKILSEALVLSYNEDKLKYALDNDEPIFLEGVIQRANKKNQNNRIYPREVLEEQIDKYNREFVSKGSAIGELDHPSGEDRVILEYATASHKIHKIWWNGDDVWARIEILSGKFFPSANILRGCLKNRIPIGFSSRGYGSEMQISESTFEVQDDFELVCWDAVVNPSTHGAFGYLAEGKGRDLTYKAETVNQINNLINYIIS